MIEFEEDWLFSVVFRWRGSVAPRALWFALPAACLAPLLLLLDDIAPDVRDGAKFESVASSVLWSSTTACVIFLVGFRSRQALGRFWEGTGLLHQMRGEWFDAASCLMTFSRSARASKSEEVAEFRQTLVRLMSLMHASALEEIKANHTDTYEVIDIRGLDSKTRNYLRACKEEHGFNRVEVLLHMVQVLVTQNLDDGVLKIAPPILSRVYQTLSRGFVNLLSARKLTDTKFPFPYVQLISGLLIFHSILTPVVIAAIVHHKGWAALLTFVPVFGLLSLNFIAIELECPFGDDENDLPLEQFQKEMNTSLLMLLIDEADHLAHTSKTAVTKIGSLTRSLAKSCTRSLDGTTSLDSRASQISLPRGSVMSATPKVRFNVADAGSDHSERKVSVFDSENIDMCAVRDTELNPGIGRSVEQVSISQQPPLKTTAMSDHQEKNHAQEINEEVEMSCDFIVHSRASPQLRVAGKYTAPRDVGSVVDPWTDTDQHATEYAAERLVVVDCQAPVGSDGMLTRQHEEMGWNRNGAPFVVDGWESNLWSGNPASGDVILVDAAASEHLLDQMEL